MEPIVGSVAIGLVNGLRVRAVFTNISGTTITNTAIMIVIQPLQITTCTLAGGKKGVTYTSTTLATSGGQAPISWLVTSRSLTKGLSLRSPTRVISGKPSVKGTFTFTIQAADSLLPTHQTATHSFSITIA